MAIKKDKSELVSNLHFSCLVSVAGTVMDFKAVESEPLTDSMKQTFAKLTELTSVMALAFIEAAQPDNALASAQISKDEDNTWRWSEINANWAHKAGAPKGPLGLIFPSWEDRDWVAFGIAASELASDIRKAIASHAFKESAQIGSRLLGHAGSSGRFHFPMLGLALAPARVALTGKTGKERTLAAFKLGVAEPVDVGYWIGDRAPNDEASQTAQREIEANWEGVAASFDENEVTHLRRAIEQIEVFKGGYREGLPLGSIGGLEKFIAGAEGEGGAVLTGENPLPSMRLLEKVAAYAERTGEPKPKITNESFLKSPLSKSDQAEDLAWRARHGLGLWEAALCAALGQAPFTPDAMLAMKATALRLGALNGEPWRIATGDDGELAGALLAESIDAPEETKAADLKKIGEASGSQRFALLLKRVSPVKGKGVKLARLMKQIADILGPGISQVADKFALREPRVAILQAAGLMSPALEAAELLREQMDKILQNDDGDKGDYDDYDYDNSKPWWHAAAVEKKERLDTISEGDDRMGPKSALAGIRALMAAVEEARQTYSTEAFFHATAQEALWMNQAGFGLAWEQALAMGEPSATSIAWSLANPMGAALRSADPIERLAAASARAFGLSSKLEAKDVAEQYNEALTAKGATPEALKLLAQSKEARTVLLEIAQALSGPEKIIAQAAGHALVYACAALSACAEQSLGPEASGAFLITSMEKTEYGEFVSFPAVDKGWGNFDGFGPELGAAVIKDQNSAQILRELGDAKTAGYKKFVGLLVADWVQTEASAVRVGWTTAKARTCARARHEEIRLAMPTVALMDWRGDWDTKHAWQLFGMPSPALDAALRDATDSGGALGVWAAQRARGLGVDDARDGNDLVGRVRDAVRVKAKMSEAAWKLAIKTPAALATLDQLLKLKTLSPSYQGPALLADCVKSLKLQALLPRAELLAAPAGVEEFGLALTAAALGGIKPELATAVAHLLFGAPKGANLFGLSLQAQVCQGSKGGAFFEQEARAKQERQPKIFVEACRRFEKLKADALSPAPGVDVLPASETFANELIDLGDWISSCEAGLWSHLPKDPTWGQLRRLSKVWHDEQALIAVEKMSRLELKGKIAEAKLEAEQGLNPYAAKVSARWAPVLKQRASEGWEAVELLSSTELNEEGAAMRHCVSSYSGTCRDGRSRIFSVRLNGRRISTLQIGGNISLAKANPETTFFMQQNRGIYNQAVSRQCTEFCQDTVLAFANAWALRAQGIQEKIKERHDAIREAMLKKREEEKKARRSIEGASSLVEGSGPLTGLKNEATSVQRAPKS